MLMSKPRRAGTASDGAAATRIPTKRRNQMSKKALQRRKPVHRKRHTQKDNEWAGVGQTFNTGYNTGFAIGFEDGHQSAYEQQP
ncbi:MAG: hypothetical protein ACQEXQ_16520 [Bacillota bacterium]